jgi:hypothetical protein
MNRKFDARRVMVMAALCLMLLALPMAAYAQESTANGDTAALEEQPKGGGTLMLLAGIGAVVAVAGIWLIRERTEGERK